MHKFLISLITLALSVNSMTFGVYPIDPNLNQGTTITMNFAGDCMLAEYKDGNRTGGFNSYSETKSPDWFFSGVAEQFAEDDFTVVNLENVFSDQNLEIREKPENPAYWYKSATKNAQILLDGSIEGVSVANNHTYDYGNEGYLDTVKTLNEYGIPYSDDSKTMYFEKDGCKVAVICCNMWGSSAVPSIIKRIQEAEENSDCQIVFYHGGTEREHEPDDWRITASRALIDGGADIVLGNHPHVIQPMETYKGCDIVYSLGNFCFGGSYRFEKQTIIYNLVLNFDKDKNLVAKNSKIIPCNCYSGDVNDFRPVIVTDETEKENILKFMRFERSTPN